MHARTLRLLSLSASIGLASAGMSRAAGPAVASAAPPAGNPSVVQSPATQPPAVQAPADPVQSAEARLDAANARAANIESELNAARQDGAQLRNRLSRGDEALPEIQAKIQSASARLSARQREMAVEDIPYAPLKFADDKARMEAIGEFEKSPDYRAALQSVTDSAAEMQKVQNQSIDRLSAGNEFQAVAKEAQSADAALEAARREAPANPLHFSSAAQASADAHKRLDALKSQRLEADPNVAIAQSRLAATKGAVDALRQRFMDEQLPQIPKVAEADSRLKREQGQYDELSKAAAMAEKDLADAREQLDRQNAGLTADRASLEQLTGQLVQMQNDLAGAQSAVSQAKAEVNSAQALADASDEQARNAAAAAVAQQPGLPPVVYSPSTTYQFAPPAVIYGGPSVIYAPAPYYGSYGYGGIYVGGSRGYARFGDSRGFGGYGGYHGGGGGVVGGGHGSHGGGGHR